MYITSEEKSKNYNLTGAKQFDKGDLAQAEASFRNAINLNPSNFAAYNNLGNVYRKLGKIPKAIEYYKKTIKLNPNVSQPYNNLAKIYFEKKDFNKALTYAKKSLEINPEYYSSYAVLGPIYMTIKEYEKAVEVLQKYLTKNPDANEERLLLAKAYTEYGNSHINNEDYEKALDNYSKAIKNDPDLDVAHANIGMVLNKLGNEYKAINHLEKALKINNKNTDAYYTLGLMHIENGKWDDAKKVFNKCTQINPKHTYSKSLLTYANMQTCDWKNLNTKSYSDDTPLLNIYRFENQKTNLNVAKKWSDQINKKVSHLPKFEYRYKKSKKIKIGYISSNFINHPTSYLMSGIFKLHNRKRFTINTYSYGPDDKSYYRKLIEKDSDNFIDLSTTNNYDAAKKINQDQVDILVNLNCYSVRSRMAIDALKPAPIQVSRIGLPGTTGSDFIDYIITDKTATPRKDEKFFTEKFAYMPDTFFVNSYKVDKNIAINKKLKRSSMGLPIKGFVFSSFNQPVKYTPKVFNTWTNILKKVDGSVLWLWQTNEYMKKNITKWFDKRDISRNRIIFAPSTDYKNHMNRLSLSDLALDTFICNGHTTTSDSLWVGVPVITIKGGHLASRVSASLLKAIGLNELITKSPKEYEKLAIQLANSSSKLRNIKEKLRENRDNYPIFDTNKFVYNLEKLYILMWDRYMENKKPMTITLGN